jgi:hypothetical protein
VSKNPAERGGSSATGVLRAEVVALRKRVAKLERELAVAKIGKAEAEADT